MDTRLDQKTGFTLKLSWTDPVYYPACPYSFLGLNLVKLMDCARSWPDCNISSSHLQSPEWYLYGAFRATARCKTLSPVLLRSRERGRVNNQVIAAQPRLIFGVVMRLVTHLYLLDHSVPVSGSQDLQLRFLIINPWRALDPLPYYDWPMTIWEVLRGRFDTLHTTEGLSNCCSNGVPVSELATNHPFGSAYYQPRMKMVRSPR